MGMVPKGPNVCTQLVELFEKDWEVWPHWKQAFRLPESPVAIPEQSLLPDRKSELLMVPVVTPFSAIMDSDPLKPGTQLNSSFYNLL